MDIEKYIGYYEHVWDSDLYCDGIRETNYDYQPSSYSDHVGKVKADKRVRMDEVWVRFGDKGYDDIKKAVEYTCRLYSEEHPRFSVQRMTDHRINRYSEGGFMSKHCDNIHHSHGQQYGFPQATVLLYLNDDYEGGWITFWGKYNILSGGNSAHVYPSNHLFKHEVTPVTKGERYSVITWFSYEKGKEWLT